jgi:hypothetical protein
MRGISRQLNHPSPGLASLAPLRPLPADAGRGEKKDRLSPAPSDGEGFTSECGSDERGSTQKAKIEGEYKVI